MNGEKVVSICHIITPVDDGNNFEAIHLESEKIGNASTAFVFFASCSFFFF